MFVIVLCSQLCYYIFFFFKQKTAYEMRISDWSSDVCSSDLKLLAHGRNDLRLLAQAALLFGMPGKMMGDVGKLRRHRIEPARKEPRRHREHLLLRLEARIAAPCGHPGQQVVALALIAFGENSTAILRPEARRVGKGDGRSGRHRWSRET